MASQVVWSNSRADNLGALSEQGGEMPFSALTKAFYSHTQHPPLPTANVHSLTLSNWQAAKFVSDV